MNQKESAVDDLQTAPVGFAPRVLQFVVELGVFKVGEIEFERFANDEAVDGDVDAGVQNVFGEVARLRVGGLNDDEDELYEQQLQDRSDAGFRAESALDCRHYGVNDQLTHPRLRHR